LVARRLRPIFYFPSSNSELVCSELTVSAVIFDLDGVLADSEPWWNQIDAKLLAEYGVKYCGEYHQNVLGVSYRLAIEFYKKAFGALRAH